MSAATPTSPGSCSSSASSRCPSGSSPAPARRASSGASAAACRTAGRRRSWSSRASVPISLLAVLVVSVPLALVGVPLDGPFGALVSVTDPGGCLRRARPAARRRCRRARLGGDGRQPARTDGPLGEIGSAGALWAAADHLRDRDRRARSCSSAVPVEPVSPLPPTGTTSASPCRCWPGSSSRRSARRSSSGRSPRRPGSAVSGVTRGVVLGALRLRLRARPDDLGRQRGRGVRARRSSASPARVPIALALGWLFVRRGTIWASFGLHAAFNGILLVIAEIASRSS